MSASKNTIRIVIVDDHGLIREYLRMVFSDKESFEIVGEASDGIQAISVISELKPDIVLLDISIPRTTGLELLPIIKRDSPDTKVIMLTGKDDDENILTALRAGAKGYHSKNTSSQSIIKSISVVNKGDMWIERRLICRLFEDGNSNGFNSATQQEKNLQDLTPREQEVLCILAKGCSNKEIAETLFISEQTVKSHLNRIFKKLDVSRRLEAILYAIKNGLT